MEPSLRNRHLGSDFDEYLEEEGVLEEAEAVAAKRLLTRQILEAMQEQGLTKAEMARRMGTSRSTLNRLLDPTLPSVTLLTLRRAAGALGKGLHVELTEGATDEPSQGIRRELDVPSSQVPPPDGPGILDCADLDAMRLVWRARRGDPGALGSILTHLARHLRGEASLPREHAAFCSEALLELGETLEPEGEEFRRCVLAAMEELGHDPESWEQFRREVAQGRGPRLPEHGRSPGGKSWSQRPSRDHLGRAFCKAFHLSRPPGAAPTARGWMPHRASPSRHTKSAAFTSFDYLDKIWALLHLGESQTQAIEIVRSAVEDPKSPSTIRRWMKAERVREKLDRREQERRTLNFGFIVLALVERSADLEEACSILARTVVQRSCGLPKATVFLRPRTVKAAYDLALKHSSKNGPAIEP